jgi:hypothetical protein
MYEEALLLWYHYDVFSPRGQEHLPGEEYMRDLYLSEIVG